MSYLRKIIRHGNVIEDCKYTNGRFGLGKKNSQPTGETPPEQIRWQSKNDIRKVWRLLDNNFSPGDLWVMLSYPGKQKPTTEQVRENMAEFTKKLRRLYRKAGKAFKYIYSAGRGKRGAVHFHLVLPKFDIAIIRDLWAEIVNQGEWVKTDFQPLDRKKDYYKIASYIIKNSEETFGSDDPVYKKRYCASRNLVNKKTKAKVVKAKEWKKEPPERPGYYIDKNRSYSGYSQYGYPVQYTVYIKLDGKGRPDEPKKSREAD